MYFEFKTSQDLFEIVSKMNENFYKPAIENIVYLEELCNENAIAYMVALRDAYSHLVKIFEFTGSFTHDNKLKIERQLERYSGHLERLLFDTYQKIVSVKSRELWKILPEKQIGPIKTQMAMMIKKQRIVDDGTTIEQKLEGYKQIIEFIEETYKKYIE